MAMVGDKGLSMDFDPDVFVPGNQAAEDRKLLVKFYVKACPDETASALHGRPMFKDVEYVDIRTPGARDGVARPARQRDKERFPEHYQAFKRRQEMPEEGTPLSEWPAISRSMVEQLAFLNIKTVEQLADVPDSKTKEMMGLGNFKRLAQRFIEAAQTDAPLVKLHNELAERDARIADQAAQIESMRAVLASLEARVNAAVPEASPAPAPGPIAAPAPALEPVEHVPEYKSVLDRQPEAEAEAEAEPAEQEAPRSRRRRRGQDELEA